MVAAISAAGAIGGALISANGAKSAAGAQSASAQAGIDAQNAQFQSIQKILAPYQQAGVGALTGQQNLVGLNGNDAQAAAIASIQNSPQYAALSTSGQNAILANGSATGGLRGGNVQGALAQFQPQLLSSLIDQQYSRLGGLTSIGQNAAAGVGNAGQSSTNAITSLLQQQGAAAAGSSIATGSAYAGLAGQLSNAYGNYASTNGFGSRPGLSAGATGYANELF